MGTVFLGTKLAFHAAHFRAGGGNGPPQLGDQCWGPPWLEEELLVRGVWLPGSWVSSIQLFQPLILLKVFSRLPYHSQRSSPWEPFWKGFPRGLPGPSPIWTPSSACLQRVSTSELPRDFLFPVSKERRRCISLVLPVRRRPPAGRRPRGPSGFYK